MAVRIGLTPPSWSTDDMPELGADIPLEVCLSEAAEAGYAGVELGHKFPAAPRSWRPCCSATGWP